MSLPFASRALFRASHSSTNVCGACRRGLTISTALQSGHSKWATIKHDKAKNDAAKNKQRSVFSHEIILATKLGGPDPSLNPRLALAIERAKKASFPKQGIESAIKRGQGISSTGAALETVTVEAIFPPSVAMVIEIETESKLRSLADTRNWVKKNGGNVTPVAYLFEKKGAVVFKGKEGWGVDEMLEPALEAGALDVEDAEEGAIIVYTDPAETKAAAEKIAEETGLEIASMDIVWVPNEDTKVPLAGGESVEKISRFFDQLKEVSGVQAIYWNATKGGVEDGTWEELLDKIDDFE
ncbi:transcriptional regulator TACO1-like protein [Macrophomina phaseolina]|uniref:Transcriptional regulator TACO1-like protein n=1 Tax=Macrophomina phaseolina TaxID=35725 RepID=A0ABQ8GKI4_9PEZI|nr:transcriptional regulator TACO1-like protein [Macrophomina phaseolina]